MNKIIYLIISLIVYHTILLAQNHDKLFNVESPAHSDSLLNLSSYNQGKLDGADFNPSVFRFRNGFALGLVMPFVSMTVIKASVRGTLPLTIPDQYNTEEYTRGSLESSRLKNCNLTMQGAGAGSLISATAILIAILAANLDIDMGSIGGP